jgi:crotonobetainyl-CoA:carnitine CoA-transferase CaiB-like acyl-CoA transferase
VGPTVGKYLADHGAEVIRVESRERPEALRLAGPMATPEPNLDGSGYYANFNSSKLGAALNLHHRRGPGLAKRLVAVCDVVLESFAPGAMDRLGLTYESLAEGRDDLVMMSLPLFGQTGPWAPYRGYGHTLQAASGFNHLTGWPDGPPIGTGIAYTDFLAPHFGTLAIVAALDYRRRTGKGQYIDLSQQEASLHALGTALLEWTANGREVERMGNRDPEAAPHGCYKCKDGKYIVVACFTEKQWDGFKAALGRPDWCDLERMRRKWQRLNEQREIDWHVGAWCREFSAGQVMRRMQEFGVPLGIVKSAEDMHRDPQLRHRKHYAKLEHAVMGVRTYDTPAFKLSKTPAQLSRPAPLLGEHTEHVFREIVGLSEAEFGEAKREGAFV